MKALIAFAAASLMAGSTGALGQALDQFLKAVDMGDSKTAASLLDKGLDPDSADAQGNTALMIASRQGHRELVVLLLERKAVADEELATNDRRRRRQTIAFDEQRAVEVLFVWPISEHLLLAGAHIDLQLIVADDVERTVGRNRGHGHFQLLRIPGVVGVQERNPLS